MSVHASVKQLFYQFVKSKLLISAVPKLGLPRLTEKYVRLFVDFAPKIVFSIFGCSSNANDLKIGSWHAYFCQ